MEIEGKIKVSAIKNMIKFNLDDFKISHPRLYSTFFDVIRSLTKENEELESKKQNAVYWAETERKGRERMRKLYGQKIDEVTQLKARVKKLEEGIDDCEDWIHNERINHNADNFCPICGKQLLTPKN